MTQLENFWSKVDVSEIKGSCWPWLAYLMPDGYGRCRRGHSMALSHRVAYEMVNGPIVGGLEIDHLCSVRSCCNPSHLEAVTHAENTRRSTGASVAAARMLSKTHCPRGHEYSAENTRLQPSRAGGVARICRNCNTILKREKREASK